MTKIKSYPLIPGTQSDIKIVMPRNSQILDVVVIGGTTLLWAISDPDENETETRDILVIPNEGQVEGRIDGVQLIGNYVLGGIAFHVFDITPPPMVIDHLPANQ